MDPILDKIAERHGVAVVEDADHPRSAEYRGPAAAHLVLHPRSAFILHRASDCWRRALWLPRMTTHAVRRLRNYGEVEKYKHLNIKGLTPTSIQLQAAILRVRTPLHLRKWNEQQAGHAERYYTLVNGIEGLSFQARLPGMLARLSVFIVETIMSGISSENYLSGRRNSKSSRWVLLHFAACFIWNLRGYRAQGTFLNSEKFGFADAFTPMFTELTANNVCCVCECIRTLLH